MPKAKKRITLAVSDDMYWKLKNAFDNAAETLYEDADRRKSFGEEEEEGYAKQAEEDALLLERFWITVERNTR